MKSILRSLLFIVLSCTVPVPFSRAAEPATNAIERNLMSTRWDVNMELGQRAWGNIVFREGHEFTTMNGPQGAWKVSGERTVELGGTYVLQFAPGLASFVVMRKDGGRVATGTRKGVPASSIPLAVMIPPKSPNPPPGSAAKPAGSPRSAPDPFNLNRPVAAADKPLGITLPPPAAVPPGISPPVQTAAPATVASGGPQALPGTMLGRVSSRHKATAMEQNKMKAKSETAVVKGLDWLQKSQSAGGSWGASNTSAMTGFALLCFLGHGETTASLPYGATVRKGVDWLVKTGDAANGKFATFNQSGVYEHGIATYALAEYYVMTKDAAVVPLLKQAVTHIVEGQGKGGGWMYSYDKTADDLSVSGWQIQALKAAHLTQLNIPGVDQALDKAIAYISRVKGPKGGYGYRAPRDTYSLSGVGILCELFWKAERGILRKGMEWILEETEKNHPVIYTGESGDLYAWYYHTQACFMFGGNAWTKWNRWFQDQLADAQIADGSWPPMAAKSAGALQNGNSPSGAVYRTALCTLMLETFYRYLPNTSEAYVALPGAPAVQKR